MEGSLDMGRAHTMWSFPSQTLHTQFVFTAIFSVLLFYTHCHLTAGPSAMVGRRRRRHLAADKKPVRHHSSALPYTLHFRVI